MGTGTSGVGMLGTIGQLGTGGWPQPSPNRYLGNVDATMSILDVSMPTGFLPDLQDLKRVSAGTWGHTRGRGGDTGPCIFVPSCPTVSPYLPNPHVCPPCPCVPTSPCVPMCHCVPIFPSATASLCPCLSLHGHVSPCPLVSLSLRPRVPLCPHISASPLHPAMATCPCVSHVASITMSLCAPVPTHPCILMRLRVPTCPCVSCMPGVTVSLSPAHGGGGQVHLQV